MIKVGKNMAKNDNIQQNCKKLAKLTKIENKITKVDKYDKIDKSWHN